MAQLKDTSINGNATVSGTLLIGSNKLNVKEQIDNINNNLTDLLKTNKVLWSGCYLLQAGQTVELSEAISSQPNGVVLLFVDYTSSGVGTQGYWDCFIPKQAVSDYNGRFWSCSTQRWSASNSVACNVMKCFYISDTKITGHDYSIANDNGVYGMGSVLCKVYGV